MRSVRFFASSHRSSGQLGNDDWVATRNAKGTSSTVEG